MGKLEDEAKRIAAYAHGREVDQFGGPRPDNVVTLKVPKEATLQDEILEAVDELAADIRAGRVVPSHLVIGYAGVKELDSGEGVAVNYVWDSHGLTRFELIGHLHVYAGTLAQGAEGDTWTPE